MDQPGTNRVHAFFFLLKRKVLTAYYASKKSRLFLNSKYTMKIGQDCWDIQYLCMANGLVVDLNFWILIKTNVCPRSLVQFPMHIRFIKMSKKSHLFWYRKYTIKWEKTSWKYSTYLYIVTNLCIKMICILIKAKYYISEKYSLHSIIK